MVRLVFSRGNFIISYSSICAHTREGRIHTVLLLPVAQLVLFVRGLRWHIHWLCERKI
jgi:hypothetical protein